MMRLTRVDLPTFGRPITATTGSGPRSASASSASSPRSSSARSSSELEVLQAGPQRALDGRGVLGLGGGVSMVIPPFSPTAPGCSTTLTAALQQVGGTSVGAGCRPLRRRLHVGDQRGADLLGGEVEQARPGAPPAGRARPVGRSRRPAGSAAVARRPPGRRCGGCPSRPSAPRRLPSAARARPPPCPPTRSRLVPVRPREDAEQPTSAQHREGLSERGPVTAALVDRDLPAPAQHPPDEALEGPVEHQEAARPGRHRQHRPPSRNPMWFAARTTGPVRGTFERPGGPGGVQQHDDGVPARAGQAQPPRPRLTPPSRRRRRRARPRRSRRSRARRCPASTPSAASVKLDTVESSRSRRTTWSRVASTARRRGAVQLGRRRREPGLLAGGEQHPHLGVRRDDGGDVAALGHHPHLRRCAPIRSRWRCWSTRAHLEVGGDGARRPAISRDRGSPRATSCPRRARTARRGRCRSQRQVARGGRHGVPVVEVECRVRGTTR